MQEVRGSSPLTSTKVLMFNLYILWSQSRTRFYVGHSADLDDRLLRHNEGRSKATKAGGPWQLVHQETYDSKSEAVRRELEIKCWKSAVRIHELIGERPA